MTGYKHTMSKLKDPSIKIMTKE